MQQNIIPPIENTRAKNNPNFQNVRVTEPSSPHPCLSKSCCIPVFEVFRRNSRVAKLMGVVRFEPFGKSMWSPAVHPPRKTIHRMMLHTLGNVQYDNHQAR
eukprot:gb/GEZJ01003412.1/.p1 GENE.gb/GEZJ01003412.1/~~gb/GEZJ01003412.1/.p1  ORF type:complete len:101 (+),score=8.20 gb/GEZJ01003412.1/:521-823(+)